MNSSARRQNDANESGALGMILPVFERLRQAVVAENRELTSSRMVDYQAHSQKKSQGLLELNRLRAALASVGADPKARAALTDLSVELDINRRLLQVQLKAAQTVSSLLARAIREGQSDGTYSAYAWRDNEG